MKFLPVVLLFLALPLLSWAQEGSGKASREPGLYATLQTSKGEIVARLFEKRTPKTVENFVRLATGQKQWRDNSGRVVSDQPFYDGVLFHRVIDDFMIQTGAHLPDGGYRTAENIPDEFDSELKFDRPGRLGMANIGQPNTGNTQFFITLVPTSWLNNKHTVFGQVVEGQDVVEAIGNAPTGANDRPRQPVLLEKVTLERVGPAPAGSR